MYFCRRYFNKKSMFQLGKTIVSEEIIENDFICNLSACKGACCVDGDAGAPLDKGELKIMEEIYPKVKPFLRKEGIEAIERLGTWVVGTDQDLETPLIDNKDSQKRYRVDHLIEAKADSLRAAGAAAD